MALLDAQLAQQLEDADDKGVSPQDVEMVGEDGIDERIELLRSQIASMEKETAKEKPLPQESTAAAAAPAPAPAASDETWAKKQEMDQRSVYVGQVDYQCTPDELADFFSSIGQVNRVTILCNRWTGKSKGFAYIEFDQQQGAQDAVQMNGKEFRERVLKVALKRTNLPWWQKPGGAAGGKGRGGSKGYRGRTPGRGRGGWGWGWASHYSPYGTWRPTRGRGKGRW